MSERRSARGTLFLFPGGICGRKENLFILDVQVVGVPDPKYGEQVLACIRVKPGETLTEEAVLGYCEGKIARFKIPKYIQFVAEYPMTASGKIQKFKLREHAIQAFGLLGTDGSETA